MWRFSAIERPKRFDSLREANDVAAALVRCGRLPEVKRYPRIGSAEFAIRVWNPTTEAYMWLLEVDR
jgi:hypothetical protein